MAEKRAKNLSYLRSSNQGQVIQTLLTSETASRNMLAGKLGLTKMSITYLVTDLMEKGIVEEIPSAGAKTVGRRASLLRLVPDSLRAIGVYVSRSSVLSSISNISGKMIKAVESPHSAKATKQSITDVILEQIRSLLQEFPDKPVVGIGVSCIGLVDIGSGIVLSTTDFHGIADWHIRETLQAEFGLPVYVANDMKAASLAESYYGAGRANTDFVYLGITNGIGAGVIINGRLFEGSRGVAAELGHTSIRPRGKKCICGNTGCMEQYLSVPALLKQFECEDWGGFLKLCNSADTDPRLDQFIEELGSVLVNLVNTFDPQILVIGHEGAQLGNYCFERLQVVVNERALSRNMKRVPVLPSAFGPDIVWLCAASLVFSHLFQGDISV